MGKARENKWSEMTSFLTDSNIPNEIKLTKSSVLDVNRETLIHKLKSLVFG